MADKKISALPAASTPLAGTEVLPIVQGGVTDQVSVANLTVGRDVSVKKLNPTDNVVMAAGKGIDFSANSNAPGMTSEVLNWYEQGTFTPVLSSSGTLPTITSYTTQYGAYTRIGNRVFVSVQLRATLLAVGTGYPVITGFPYAAAGNSFNGPSFGLTTMLNLGANSYYNGNTLNLLGSTYTLAGDYLTFSLMYEV